MADSAGTVTVGMDATIDVCADVRACVRACVREEVNDGRRQVRRNHIGESSR